MRDQANNHVNQNKQVDFTYLEYILEIPDAIQKILAAGNCKLGIYDKALHSKFNAEMTKIHEDIFGWDPDEDFWTQKDIHEYCLLLTTANSVIGYVRFGIDSEDYYHYLRVDHFAVNPHYRNNGAGSLLMSAFMHNANLIHAEYKDIKFVYVNISLGASNFYGSSHGGGFCFLEDDDEKQECPQIGSDYNAFSKLPIPEETIATRRQAFVEPKIDETKVSDRFHVQPKPLGLYKYLKAIQWQQRLILKTSIAPKISGQPQTFFHEAKEADVSPDHRIPKKPRLDQPGKL